VDPKSFATYIQAGVTGAERERERERITGRETERQEEHTREREREREKEREKRSLTENQAGRLGRAASSQQSASNLRAFARSINGGNSSRPAATKIQFEC